MIKVLLFAMQRINQQIETYILWLSKTSECRFYDNHMTKL